MKLIHTLLRFFAATQKSKWKQHQKWVHGSAWTFKTQQEKCCPVFSTCNLETLIVLVAEKLFCKWLFLIWERAMKLKTVLAMNLRLWNQWRLGICACRKCSGIDFFLLSTFHAYVWIPAQPCYFLATKKTELQIQLGSKIQTFVLHLQKNIWNASNIHISKSEPTCEKVFFTITWKRGLAVFVHWPHARDGYVELVFSFSKNVFLLEFWCALKLWEFFSIEHPFRNELTAFIFKTQFENRVWRCFFKVAVGMKVFFWFWSF